MCTKIFTLKYLLICFCATHLVTGRLKTSSPRFEAFFRLDDHIVTGLERYVRHETNRLEIIKNSTGYEDEVPIVVERIELLKDFYEKAQANASAIAEDMRLLRAYHPTTSFVAVKNFVLNWRPLLKNQTRYGFRLLEFLNVSDADIPNYEDISNLRGDIVNLQTFYNLSVNDIYKGDILGVKGAPLTIMDAYDIGRHAQNDVKLTQALDWYQLVVNESKKVNNKTDVDRPMLLTDLAMMLYQHGDIEKAQAIAREAYALRIYSFQFLRHGAATLATKTDVSEINLTDTMLVLWKLSWADDTHDQIYKRFVRIENENVKQMSNFNDFAPSYWQNFTKLCQANSTLQTPLQWYHRCRLRCSPNPLRRYKEEILSVAPYLSVFYDLINDTVIEDIKNQTAKHLKHSRNKYFHNYDGTQVKDFPESGQYLAHLASEISGLNATYTEGTISSGSPFRVLKFGFGGKATPHNHKSMKDPMMTGAGRKLASVEFYLSDVKTGGATVFMDIGVRYQPRKGSALLWYNIMPNWNDDLRLHVAECSHAIGEKWIVQKEMYTRQNIVTRPCARKYLGNQIGVDRAVHRFRHCGF